MLKKHKIIKRYANRKLYDMDLSRYVTVDEVAEQIKNGYSVKIIDNKSGTDITSNTLSQIVLEAEKKTRHKVNTSVLESIIKSGTLSSFFQSSSSSVKHTILDIDKWFSKIIDTNKYFWNDIKKNVSKNKDSEKFQEYGIKMEEYFSSTINKLKYNTSRELTKNEREIISLRQKINDLENKIEEYENENKRLKQEN